MNIAFLNQKDSLLCLRLLLLAVDLTEELGCALGQLGRLGVDMPHLEHGLHQLSLQDVGHEVHLALKVQGAVLALSHVLAQSLEFKPFNMNMTARTNWSNFTSVTVA